ncbi:aminotransferase class I/II-fold pyridoxal phosphate-dependent enzyme [Arthrobacter sp. UM1]|uniref:aminotransferase class I/II-fold pyridoxal phosphate-dependent enzyme n=1 Tax=Arthrobacter sp. UM1 TaxID=2766776 RepID=UPI001CF6EEDF|nr:aminotransferase class I/II-fold pyridoxal phosphate-dependent enzyme [Arthrobacter sp. UM1]MCB4208805.1 aminotransferase class I/II-fold pyridoxal phosphate-dependent enzyme [Arthrobacter sp. UM1]
MTVENSRLIVNIKSGTVDVEEANLTEFEYAAINCHVTNVADGHARQKQTRSQAAIIDDLPAVFRESERTPVDELEYRAHRAFFGMLGQTGYPAEHKDRIFACYASSVAMEILARALATEVSSLALVHPTFDNIPDILKGMHINLVPFEEELLHGGERSRVEDLVQSVGAVFITTPNNPTGRVLGEKRLRMLAEICAASDAVLCLDTSFRGFDPRAQYDHYSILENSGCRWAVVEDTGKLWPTLDLKVGWLVTSANLNLPVGKVYSDILLGVSPMILTLVRRFAEDGTAGGLVELQKFIAENREIVREGLRGLDGVTHEGDEVYGSVERVFMERRSSSDVWSELADSGVYVLPCHKFHWARPEEGDTSLRIALARDPENLALSVRRIREVLERG